MASFIQNLVAHSLGDGARAAKFQCGLALNNPGIFNEEVLNVLVKSSSFPGKSLTTTDLKYKGRTIPVKGQVKYSQNWDCTFYLSEDHKLKRMFELWIESIDQIHHYSDQTFNSELQNYISFNSNNGYTTDMIIAQLNFDMDEQPIVYTLFNVFPIHISQVDTNSESVGQISEFTVTFSYTHFETNYTTKEKLLSTNLVDLFTSFAKDQIGAFKSFVSTEINNAIDSNINIDDSKSKISDMINKFL